MGSRTRKATPLGDAALDRVTATARTRPDSATATSGFTARVVAALYPAVPAWIHIRHRPRLPNPLARTTSSASTLPAIRSRTVRPPVEFTDILMTNFY